jgi:lipopolysaccharide transport system permease protein
MRAFQSAFQIWAQFYQREIKNRYLGSLSGLAWVFLHPLLLLILYTFLIAGVLKARIPGLSENQWLPYVALGLWPWMCFSEGINRGSSVVLEYAGLLNKVAIPAELLVAANVAATFTLHALGLLLIVLILHWKEANIVLINIWVLLPLLACLFLLTLGLTWIASALQVYARDVGQLLSQVLGFMFFLTPVLYTPQMLPSSLQPWLAFNPVSIYCTTARAFLMQGGTANFGSAHGIALMVALLIAVLGLLCFRKLAKHFEDFA